MGYFKSINQIKQIVEERNKMSPEERSRQLREDLARKLNEEKRRKEEEAKARESFVSTLIASKPVYQSGYDAAVSNHDWDKRVVFRDLIDLADFFSSLKDKLSLSMINSLLPDENGKVDTELAKQALSRLGIIKR